MYVSLNLELTRNHSIDNVHVQTAQLTVVLNINVKIVIIRLSSTFYIFAARSEMGSQLEEQNKPRFIRQLRNITVTEGENAMLDCVLVGYPEPKV